MGRGPRPADSQPTPAATGSVAMPRDGDPMNQPKVSLAPAPPEPSTRSPSARRLAPRAGQKKVVLTASNGRGGELKFVFARTRAGIEFWRSLDADRSAPTLVRTFAGPFTARAVADLLASGEAGPAIDEADVEEAAVAGTEDRWSNLIRLAWSRQAGALDVRVKEVLALSDEMLDEVDHRVGGEDLESLVELGKYLEGSRQAWIGKWRAEIDAEVVRRAEVEGRPDDEVRCRALRAFVETCLLTLGRMPFGSENAEAWAGAGLAGRNIGVAQRRKLRLVQSGRVRRFRVRVVFWTAANTYGYSDFGPGPGWYWIVRNPDPNWRFCDPMGPYKTPEEAWDDASCLGEE
jgi:hypothetical protein